jgi:hypothetical protein
MKVFLKKYSPSLLILLFSFLAYGLLIPWLGFYWDDWPMAWFAKTLGPSGFKEVLSSDRPFLMGIYMFTTSILPMKPVYWQAFALLSRWLCGISVYWALSKIWPELKKQMLWVSILFTVFPGFKQQPIAIIYSNGFFLLTSFFLSLGLMVKAMQAKGRKKILLIIGSVFLQLFTIFSTEYYAGLEFLRILIIWNTQSLDLRKFKIWFQTMFREYLPYAIGLLFFFIWRVFIFKFPTYHPVTLEELSGSRYPAIIVFLNRMIQDMYLAIWKSWSDIFQFPNLSTIAGSSQFFYWGLVLLLIPISYFLLKNTFPIATINKKQNSLFAKYENQILVFAISALMLGAFPFWATNLPIELTYPYDRFFLSLMFGSSLLLVYLIEKLFQSNKVKLFLLSLLIGFSVGAHFINANMFRREWNIHNDFFWQLSWRVPALEEGTLLLTETLPMHYYSDNSLTAPLNWIYDTSNSHVPLKYMMMFTAIRLGSSLPDLQPGTPVSKNYRSTDFVGNTDQTVGFFYTTDACLRILDPQQSHDDPLLPDSLDQIINLSDPNRILPEDQENPFIMDESVFGKEPAHGWCYFYEKADLARQYKDWKAVLEIQKQVIDQSLEAKAGSEYLPFSEALAALGDWENSMRYIQKAYSMDKQLEKRLCAELNRYKLDYLDPHEKNAFLISEMDLLDCP